jgi:class 3 adenylate cyclase
VAARIAALAEAGEILVSQDTAEFAPAGSVLAAPRTVALKGLTETLDVVTLSWR